jgi:3',5'-cyclic AMP phosphodiesterase CpdA
MVEVKLLLLSDLHYPAGKREAEAIAKLAARLKPDAVIIAGDTVVAGLPEMLSDLLELMRASGYRGMVLLVSGNHEHYVPRWARWSSAEALRALRDVALDHGATLLDLEGPAYVKGLWVAGAAGWYDYSLAPSWVGPREAARCNPYGSDPEILHMFCPGAGPWGVPEECGVWSTDCLYIRLPYTPSEYMQVNIERLKRQLDEAGDPAIVAVHHVPRRDLLLYTGGVDDFHHTYSGTEKIDAAIMEYAEKVLMVVYGHLHGRCRRRISVLDGITYVHPYPSSNTAEGAILARVVPARKRVVLEEKGRL